jgi:glycosyltransferase involved in cell wall biosynthesis
LKRLRPDREPIRLHVVGGDSRNAFDVAQRVMAEEGVSESVHFWGAQLPEALPQFYRRCDFMLALPLWDPCPNAVVEALSCGLPVVATDAGGIPELVGEAGRIVPEPLPLSYADHERYERLPPAPVEQVAEEAARLLERLDDYRALARERAVSALDIRMIALQYLKAAEQLIKD